MLNNWISPSKCHKIRLISVIEKIIDKTTEYFSFSSTIRLLMKNGKITVEIGSKKYGAKVYIRFSKNNRKDIQNTKIIEINKPRTTN